jgi:glycosyltransferase involved in cell wall biosynthesis
MNLGFHYHIPAKQVNNDIFVPGFLGFFIDSIAQEVTTLVCFMHSPLEHEISYLDYKLVSNNIKLVIIGPHSSIPIRLLNSYIYRKSIFKSPVELDAILVRSSTPLLPLIYNTYKSRICLLIVSDAIEGLDNIKQPWWRLKLIKLWAHWYQKREDLIASKSLTFVNSDRIFEKLKTSCERIFLTKTTTLRLQDFFIREDTCNSEVIEFLFTGRITRTKGILDILEALKIMKDVGLKFKLNIVGMVSKGDNILEEIKIRLNELGLGDDEIIFHGYKPAGDTLLAYYRTSDIYITASKGHSEGFPRTLWEAMASSLPIIASRVSSIPGYIGHCAEIIEPSDINDIVRGIKEIINNDDKRKANIRNGMKLAKTNTLEFRAKEICDIIKINHYNL